jgi:GDP-4-dehydro-6-deoxy-D-mannose reductase
MDAVRLNEDSGKPTILITGVGGFTGMIACEHFEGRGLEVIGVVRSERQISCAAHRLQVCDLTDRQQVRRLVETTRPHYVLHLAGRNAVQDSWRDPVAYMDANMMATLHLLDALRGDRDCRIVVAGSMLSFAPGEDDRPLHPYSLSKTFQMLAAQSWAHLFGQQVMVARPSNLIGPGPSNGLCGLLARKSVAIEQGLDYSPFRLSSLVEERDYLDVRDAVKGYEHILLYGTPGTVYPIGSGSNRTIKDIVRAFQTEIGMDLPLEIGQLDGYVPPRPVDLTLIAGLGWSPEIAFERSVADILRYFRTIPRN